MSFVKVVALKLLALVKESEREFSELISTPVAEPIALTRSPVPPATHDLI